MAVPDPPASARRIGSARSLSQGSLDARSERDAPAKRRGSRKTMSSPSRRASVNSPERVVEVYCACASSILSIDALAGSKG